MFGNQTRTLLVLFLGACTIVGRQSHAAMPDVVVPVDSFQDTTSKVVAKLDFDRFRRNIEVLAGFGTRYWSQRGNLEAGDWIAERLRSYGYEVKRHRYSFRGRTRENVYATRIGTAAPDKMYIVSAHFDSFNTQRRSGAFAPGADDDASGVSLVLEAARVFAGPRVTVDTSVRFILWNNEETGLNGSRAYVRDRWPLQGIEEPRGSNSFPEPTWLGVFQHDMILFDHGLPPQPNQIAEADIDVEYAAGSVFAEGSLALANALVENNTAMEFEYPAEIGPNMSSTDSVSFQDFCPAVSLRENRRLSEIGRGSNPHWHKDSDNVTTYSLKDYRLGFSTVQTTVATVAVLASARMIAD